MTPRQRLHLPRRRARPRRIMASAATWSRRTAWWLRSKRLMRRLLHECWRAFLDSCSRRCTSSNPQVRGRWEFNKCDSIMVVFSQGFCIYSSFGSITVLSIALASKLLFECDLLMKRSNMLGHGLLEGIGMIEI